MKKTLVGLGIAGASILSTAGTASASHEHYVMREDRNGETHCRYIAEGQTSRAEGEGGHHKFHENVHTGQPGTDEHGTSFDKSENQAECDHVNDSGQH